MTKVGRIFEEEKQEALKEACKETSREIAKSLLEILSPEEVARREQLDIEEVKRLMNR